jgi:hypothetical membrane protein
MEWLAVYYNIFSVGFIILVITSAHLAAGRQYSWANNTITDLGAQGYSRNWIMRFGFIGFGLIMTTGLLFKVFAGNIFYLVDIPMLLYATAFIFTGVFCCEPFTEGSRFSETSGMLHVLFNIAAAFGIVIAVLMSAILEQNVMLRTAHALFLVMILLTSGLIGFRKRIDGVVQRLMYITSFVWLVFFYNM